MIKQSGSHESDFRTDRRSHAKERRVTRAGHASLLIQRPTHTLSLFFLPHILSEKSDGITRDEQMMRQRGRSGRKVKSKVRGGEKKIAWTTECG